jgi:hypothetical protein
LSLSRCGTTLVQYGLASVPTSVMMGDPHIAAGRYAVITSMK